MKKMILLFAIFGVILSGYSQTVLLEDDEPDRVFDETQWGPNRQYFGYWFWAYGLPVPIGSDSYLKLGTSGKFNFGYAYKLKTFSFMDIGAELSYNNCFFSLDENTMQSFDTIREWDKIRSFQNGLEAQMFLRFYLNPKRGNYFGPYVDLGFWANYHMNSGWLKKYKDDDIKLHQREYANSDFIPLTYGPYFSFGRNQISAFAQYNLSAVLSEDAVLDPMPDFVIGFKLNLYSAN
jgi:hypothetical protein